jgi:hypothetical protein
VDTATKTLNPIAWGYVEDALTDQERKAVLGVAGAWFGGKSLERKAPPAPEAVQLPAPRVATRPRSRPASMPRTPAGCSTRGGAASATSRSCARATSTRRPMRWPRRAMPRSWRACSSGRRARGSR